MIRDLIGAGDVTLQTDVLIIGAGTLGLVLAHRLAEMGRRVVCLESGGREQTGDTHPFNRVEQAGHQYSGAELGRARCLGGTSTRWGGALIPFQPPDMRPDVWPVTWEELAPYLAEVEALFGLPPGPYEDDSFQIGQDYIARLAKWPAFARRNVYSLLRDRIQSTGGPEIWINATAVQWNVEDHCLREVCAKSHAGDTLTVRLQSCVLAAGAIESTRLLLLLEQQNPGAVQGKGLGVGFHDHLSAVVADVEVRHRRQLNKLVGFRFCRGGGMRNVRFELAPTSTLRQTMPPCFAHIGFTDSLGGFNALRDLYRAIQRREFPDLPTIFGILHGAPWLLKALWWRLVQQRLLYPDGSKLQMHLVIEQDAHDTNCIALSATQRDQFGLPLARIDWRVLDEDQEKMLQASERLLATWNSGPAAVYGTLQGRCQNSIKEAVIRGGGIYHPGGTTRMAYDANSGVTDKDLRVYGVSGLRICSTSVLPTGGGANPTMMAMLLGLRAIESL